MRWLITLMVLTSTQALADKEGVCKKHWSVWTQLCGEDDPNEIKECLLTEPTAQDLALSTLKSIAFADLKLNEQITKVRTLKTPDSSVLDSYATAASATCPALQSKFFKALAQSQVDKEKLLFVLRDMVNRSFSEQPTLLSISIDSLNIKISQQKGFLKLSPKALSELDALNKEIRMARETQFKANLNHVGETPKNWDPKDFQKFINAELNDSEKLRAKMQAWSKKHWPKPI